MRFEWCAARYGIYCLCTGRQGVAGYDYILIACAAAFGRYYGSVIFGCDFVDDADETFCPAVFVVVGFRGGGRRRDVVSCVGEAGLGVRYPWEGEG